VMVGGKPVEPPQAASKEVRQVAEMSLRIDIWCWPLKASRRLPFEGNSDLGKIVAPSQISRASSQLHICSKCKLCS
jgi:hypothetical protein